MKFTSRIWSGVLLAVLLAASPQQLWAADKGPTVFAAASLKNALDAVAGDWKKKTGHEAVISYAATSALAKQVEQGAEADVFVSADLAWMDYLAERKRIDPKTRFNLLANQLVLIAPKDSEITTTIKPGFPLAELLGDGRLAIAGVDAVPAGKYGKAALQSLGVWDEVKDKLAQAENVRAALRLVSRGEAAARDRLCERRQGRSQCECGGRVPRGQPSADRLPRCKACTIGIADGERLSRVSALARSRAPIRGKWLRRLGVSLRLPVAPYGGSPCRPSHAARGRNGGSRHAKIQGTSLCTRFSKRSPRPRVKQGGRGEGSGYIYNLCMSWPISNSGLRNPHRRLTVTSASLARK